MHTIITLISDGILLGSRKTNYNVAMLPLHIFVAHTPEVACIRRFVTSGHLVTNEQPECLPMCPLPNTVD